MSEDITKEEWVEHQKLNELTMRRARIENNNYKRKKPVKKQIIINDKPKLKRQTSQDIADEVAIALLGEDDITRQYKYKNIEYLDHETLDDLLDKINKIDASILLQSIFRGNKTRKRHKFKNRYKNGKAKTNHNGKDKGKGKNKSKRKRFIKKYIIKKLLKKIKKPSKHKKTKRKSKKNVRTRKNK